MAHGDVMSLAYTGCGKKTSPLKFFAVFSATAWNFNLKFCTFICWNLLHLTVKQNLILLKKWRSYRLFNMTAYRFFSIPKMFWLQHQFNNIVETTQLTNDQMPEFHCQSKCSKCSPPAPSNNTSFQSPYLRNLLQPCRSVPEAGCPR